MTMKYDIALLLLLFTTTRIDDPVMGVCLTAANHHNPMLVHNFVSTHADTVRGLDFGIFSKDSYLKTHRNMT